LPSSVENRNYVLLPPLLLLLHLPRPLPVLFSNNFVSLVVWWRAVFSFFCVFVFCCCCCCCGVSVAVGGPHRAVERPVPGIIVLFFIVCFGVLFLVFLSFFLPLQDENVCSQLTRSVEGWPATGRSFRFPFFLFFFFVKKKLRAISWCVLLFTWFRPGTSREKKYNALPNGNDRLERAAGRFPRRRPLLRRRRRRQGRRFEDKDRKAKKE